MKIYLADILCIFDEPSLIFEVDLFLIMQFIKKSKLVPGLPALNLPEKCEIPSFKYLLLYPICLYFR